MLLHPKSVLAFSSSSVFSPYLDSVITGFIWDVQFSVFPKTGPCVEVAGDVSVEISHFPPRFSVSPYFSHIVKCPFP